MRVFSTVPQEDLRRVAAAARAVEAEGYDGVVAMENKHDPFLAQGPQRTPVFGAVDAAGAAHARICTGAARDLALLEDR